MNKPTTAYEAQSAWLRKTVAELGAVLPIQAPLQDFVHFNPLMNYEHLPFEQALRTVYQQSGSLGYLPAREYRLAYQQGRINRYDILHVLEQRGVEADEHEIWLTILTHDIKPISFQQMRWQVEENHALERFQADVAFEQREKLLEATGQDEATAIASLWQTCLQHLGLQDALLHPEALMNLRPADLQSPEGQPIPDAEALIHSRSRNRLHTLLDQVGVQFTLRGLLQRLTGTDVMEQVMMSLTRHMAVWLDQGMAATQHAGKHACFYSYWRQSALHDLGPLLDGVDAWQDYLESLDDDPLETIHQELIRIGIDKKHWEDYLRTLALELPGWSGQFHWRAQHPHYLKLPARVALEDYLAVRLATEHLYCRRLAREHWRIDATIMDIRGYFHHHLDEFYVRYHAYNTLLPEYLQHLAQQFLESQEDILPAEWHQLAHQILTWNVAPVALVPLGTDLYRKAWRLFHLAQHLGMDARLFAHLTSAQSQRLLDILVELDDPNTSGYLWLLAYEYHFQTEVFSALLNKHATGKPSGLANPAAQLIFCMDDREESVRRHLEELDPELETFGAAGVFGLPNNWRALDSYQPLKLAQPVVTAVHEFREVPDASAQHRLKPHLQRRQWLERLKRLKNHAMRHGVVSTALALPVLAPFALLELAGRSLAPAAYQRGWNRLQRASSIPLATRVQYTAKEVLVEPSGEHNQIGLSQAEKVSKVAAFLKLTGFTRDFAPLVVLMAHRSRHLNNPHILGYGCGACSGRFGGPNARAFAGMCNEPAVRQALADEHGIHLPEGCWFTAAEHDTTSDDIDWFDTDLIPASHRELFARVRQATEQAARHSAHERCRKFASAPRRLSPQQAKRHVQGRATSPDQVRAELGHQGCAVAFIGPRSLSKGIFWDRRSFLISYDPYNDPEGRLLEAQLQGNGVVGIGIAMDYYFSRMQSGYFGSGSKATHNLTGLFGVMEGASSDLRTGLAQQMVELHEPMRLLVVVEAYTATLEQIYQRHAYLRQLLDNSWVLLAVKPPDRNEIHCFQPGKGFVPWQGMIHQLPVVPESATWYAGHHGHLSPAWIVPEVTHA